MGYKLRKRLVRQSPAYRRHLENPAECIQAVSTHQNINIGSEIG